MNRNFYLHENKIILIRNTTTLPAIAIRSVGIGVAIATSCYGIYMIYYGRKMIRANLL